MGTRGGGAVIASVLLAALALPAAASPESDLGRALFYDPRLSANHAVSCASCHNPSLAWRDGLPEGRGVSLEQLGVRVPSLLAVPPGRLAAGVRAALGSPRGLDRDPEALARDLTRLPGYARAFAAVEGGPPDAERAARALTAFLREALDAPPPVLDAAAARGRALFSGKAACASCHPGDAGSDGRTHDLGGGPVVTPGLRGVAATAPYGRDARWATLREVVDFFDRGAGGREGLSPLGLTRAERGDLLAYLLAQTPPAPPAVPPLPPEGETAATIAYAPAGTAASAAAAPDAATDDGGPPLDAAARALADAESAASVLRGDAAAKACAAATEPKRLYAALESGRLAGAALGRLPDALLDEVRAERRWRALAEGRPAPCEELAALADARLGFAPEDASDCRSTAFDLAAAKALAARDPAYPALCRQALAAERPEVVAAEADAACRTAFADVAAPARLCAALPAALLKGTSAEDCVAEFSRYASPPETPRPDRGALSATLDRLALAAARHAPDACGDDGDCRAALDPGRAAVAAADSLVRARDQSCAAAARPDAAPADPGRARRRLNDARRALSRAEAARTPGDRAAARVIDGLEEKAARLDSALPD